MSAGLSAPRLRIATEDDETIVELAPLQGLWTVEQYLAITDQSRRLVEYVDGTIEVLPMPSDRHQVISQTLFLALHAYIHPRGGIVLYAPLRLRIRDGKFREPDLVLVQRRDDPRRQPRYWVGADLVVEIVSPDDPERDTVVKRADYAEAGIPEYWIVEPDTERVIVLALRDGRYHEAGVYQQSEPVRSVLLPELAIPLQTIFADP